MFLYFSYKSYKLNTSFLAGNFLVGLQLSQRLYPAVDQSNPEKNIIKDREKQVDASVVGQPVSSEDIHMGDLIQLLEGQIAPCDLLILGSSHLESGDYVCTVDSGAMSGQVTRETKKALSTVRSFAKLFNLFDKEKDKVIGGLQRLNGYLEFWPFGDNDEFKGTFKLKSDPKVAKLTGENLIRKGSLILTGSVTGIALFCGSSSLYFRDNFSKVLRSKTSSISNRTKWYSITTIVINLVFSLISTMILMIKGPNESLIEGLDPHIVNGLKFFSFLVLYSPVHPLFAETLCNTTLLILSFVLGKKYRFDKEIEREVVLRYSSVTALDAQGNLIESPGGNVPSSPRSESSGSGGGLHRDAGSPSEQMSLADHLKNEKVTVLNPVALPNLGAVEEAFFDKTGTLALPEYRIQSLATLKKMYKSRIDNFSVVAPKKRSATDRNTVEGIFGEVNIYEQDFEGYESFAAGMKYRHGMDQKHVGTGNFQIYDFVGRKLIPNPFPEMKDEKATSGLLDNSQADFDAEVEDNPNNMTVMKIDKRDQSKYGASKSGQARKAPYTSEKYDEVEFLSDSRSDKELKRMLQILTVCHGVRKVRGSNSTNHIEEKATLAFTEQFNYVFETTLSSSEEEDQLHLRTYEVKLQDGSKQSYPVYLVNDPVDGGRFSILLYDPTVAKYILYVRGLSGTMDSIIDFKGSASNKYNTVVKSNTEAGLTSLIFAQREIDGATVMETVKQYKKIVQSSLDVESDLSNLFKNLENNLSLVGVLGLKYQVRPEAKKTIEQFKMMGIKCHMLTGDDFNAAVNTATYLNLLGPNAQDHLKTSAELALAQRQQVNRTDSYVVLDMVDEADALMKIRAVLDSIRSGLNTRKTNASAREQMMESLKESQVDQASPSTSSHTSATKHVNIQVAGSSKGSAPIMSQTLKSSRVRLPFDLQTSSRASLKPRGEADIDNTRALTLSKSFVVSGRSLEVITRDVYLYNHFSFIMQFADCIVGYRMKPLHKRLLVEMAKETKGNKRIMAVGDGFNDIPMMNSADISVQIVTDQTQMVFGDLVVSNLAMIPEIMRQEGQNLSTNIAITVEGTYLNSMIVASCLFFFQFYCAFTATAPVQTGLIYATYAGYSIVGCLFSFFKHFYCAALTKELPVLFIESRFLNLMTLSKYLQLVAFF